LKNEEFLEKLGRYIPARLEGHDRVECFKSLGTELDIEQFELVMFFDFLITHEEYRHIAKAMSNGEDKYKDLSDIALSAWMVRAKFDRDKASDISKN
jgi:hypothetical protein